MKDEVIFINVKLGFLVGVLANDKPVSWNSDSALWSKMNV